MKLKSSPKRSLLIKFKEMVSRPSTRKINMSDTTRKYSNVPVRDERLEALGVTEEELDIIESDNIEEVPEVDPIRDHTNKSMFKMPPLKWIDQPDKYPKIKKRSVLERWRKFVNSIRKRTQ